MSDELPPIDAMKAKVNAFAKELQTALAAAGLARVNLIVTPDRIRLDTEGVRPPITLKSP